MLGELSQPITPSTLGNACYYVCEPLLASEVVLLAAPIEYPFVLSRSCSANFPKLQFRAAPSDIHVEMPCFSLRRFPNKPGLCVGKKKNSPPQRTTGSVRRHKKKTLRPSGPAGRCGTNSARRPTAFATFGTAPTLPTFTNHKQIPIDKYSLQPRKL